MLQLLVYTSAGFFRLMDISVIFSLLLVRPKILPKIAEHLN